MTPQEKASELYKKMHKIIETPSNKLRKQRAKECAIAAAERIIVEVGSLLNDDQLNYWNDVKTEIEKL